MYRVGIHAFALKFYDEEGNVLIEIGDDSDPNCETISLDPGESFVGIDSSDKNNGGTFGFIIIRP